VIVVDVVDDVVAELAIPNEDDDDADIADLIVEAVVLFFFDVELVFLRPLTLLLMLPPVYAEEVRTGEMWLEADDDTLLSKASDAATPCGSSLPRL
jgi:hypothetical protein